MSTTPTPMTFHHWWMMLSKVPYMTKEEVACRAWRHSAHEQSKEILALQIEVGKLKCEIEERDWELAEEMARRLDRTQRGNTKLIEALMGMVNQNFTKGHSGGLAPSFMSCDEGAIEVLIEAGFAEQVEMGNYALFWDKLEERKRDEQKA